MMQEIKFLQKREFHYKKDAEEFIYFMRQNKSRPDRKPIGPVKTGDNWVAYWTGYNEYDY